VIPKLKKKLEIARTWLAGSRPIRRVIPIWLHVPWFVVSLFTALTLSHRDTNWAPPWSPEAYLPSRIAICVFTLWCMFHRRLVDVRLGSVWKRGAR
jgi:hypothetical protein